jgi:hypothetical protein
MPCKLQLECARPKIQARSILEYEGGHLLLVHHVVIRGIVIKSAYCCQDSTLGKAGSLGGVNDGAYR